MEGADGHVGSSLLGNHAGDAFAAHAGFDPRLLRSPYLWFCVTPQRIQAWREENEIEGRDLMVDGIWRDDEGVA